jgi:hypothetical protein
MIHYYSKLIRKKCTQHSIEGEKHRIKMMPIKHAAAADAPQIFWHGPLRGVLVVAIVLSSISSFVVSCGAFLPAAKSIRYSGYAPAGRPGIHSTSNKQHRGNNNSKRKFVLAAKKNKWNNFDDFCAEQESRAITASESWIVDATGFLEPEQSSALLTTLEGRADVASLSVGSYRSSGGRRVRCVYTNPDLGYDEATAESDYVCYLKIDNVGLSQCGPWPNVLVKIGLSLENVGDVFLVSNESTVYLAVAPESEKTCVRLLPKELPGAGVTVTKLSREDLDAEMEAISDSDGMVLEDMEVQRVDKRK